MYMDLKDIAQKHNEEIIRKAIRDKLEYENKKEIITIKVDKEKICLIWFQMIFMIY